MFLQRRMGLLAGLVLLNSQCIAEPLSLLPYSQMSNYHNTSKTSMLNEPVLSPVVIDSIYKASLYYRAVGSPDSLFISCPIFFKKKDSKQASKTVAATESNDQGKEATSSKKSLPESQCTGEGMDSKVTPVACPPAEDSSLGTDIQWFSNADFIGKLNEGQSAGATECIRELFHANRDTALLLDQFLRDFEAVAYSSTEIEPLIREALGISDPRSTRGHIKRYEMPPAAESQALEMISLFSEMLAGAHLLEQQSAESFRRNLNSQSASWQRLIRSLYDTSEIKNYLTVEQSENEYTISIFESHIPDLLQYWIVEYGKLLRKQSKNSLSKLLRRTAQLIVMYKTLAPHTVCNNTTIHTLVNMIFWSHDISPPILSLGDLDSFNVLVIESLLRQGLKVQGSDCGEYRQTLIRPTEYTDFEELPRTRSLTENSGRDYCHPKNSTGLIQQP